MAIILSVQVVRARKLAAVRRQVAIGALGSAWRPALDQVWSFLTSQPGLRTDGHNVFLYHHPTDRGALMTVDFGVEVARAFDSSGEVYATETPAGEVAMAVHIGGYDRLRETHDAFMPGPQRIGGRSMDAPGRFMAIGRTIHRSLKRRSCTF
jgi:hypothetical protein